MRRLMTESVATLVLAVCLSATLVALLTPSESPCVPVGTDSATGWFGRASGYAGRLITFEVLGCSLPKGAGLVSRYILDGAGITIKLVTAAMLTVTALGVTLGLLAAQEREAPVTLWVTRVLSALSSIPVLLWSFGLFVVLRRSGMHVDSAGPLSVALLLGIVSLAFGDRLLADIKSRVEMGSRQVHSEPYMRTVRAFDLGVRRHLLQSLVPPVAELLAARAMLLVGSAIVVEKVLDLKGLGFRVIDKLGADGDHDVVMLLVLAVVCLGLALRIVSRIAVLVADGRQRG